MLAISGAVALVAGSVLAAVVVPRAREDVRSPDPSWPDATSSLDRQVVTTKKKHESVCRQGAAPLLEPRNWQVDTLLDRAEAAFEAGQHEHALKHLMDARELAPQFAPIYCTMSHVLLDEERYADAQMAASAAVAHASGEAKSRHRFWLAQLFLGLGERRAGCEALAVLRQETKSPSLRQQAGQIHAAQCTR